jgi:hypothetical protein
LEAAFEHSVELEQMAGQLNPAIMTLTEPDSPIETDRQKCLRKKVENTAKMLSIPNLSFGDEQGSSGGAEYGTLLVTRFKDRGI